MSAEVAEVERVKLERHCPRCRAHRYHFARAQLACSLSRTFTQVTINCAECGHQWNGRYRKDEWR